LVSPKAALAKIITYKFNNRRNNLLRDGLADIVKLENIIGRNKYGITPYEIAGALLIFIFGKK
jgi:hypothetical protein